MFDDGDLSVDEEEEQALIQEEEEEEEEEEEGKVGGEQDEDQDRDDVSEVGNGTGDPRVVSEVPAPAPALNPPRVDGL